MVAPIEVHIPQREIDARGALLDAWARFANERPPVIIFADPPFYCRAAGIPLMAMYDDPATMIRAQLLGWKYILERVDCDVPGVSAGIDIGSCFTASIYGCRIVEQAGSAPGFLPWMRGEEDLAQLEAMDSLTHGLRALELRYYEAYQELAEQFPVQYDGGNPVFPVRNARLNTGSEGPFTIACMAAGFDQVCLWCYDNPDFVHRLLDVLVEKEIARIRHAFAVMGETPSDIGLADDFSPLVSLDMYEEFILPTQQRMRDAFGDRVYFHSCIADAKLVTHWRDDLRIRVFNGFKPHDGLGTLRDDYTPIARALAHRVLMEPDIDGANVMSASEDELRTAIQDCQHVFAHLPGVKFCATLCGGHRVDDLAKVNVLKRTVMVS